MSLRFVPTRLPRPRFAVVVLWLLVLALIFLGKRLGKAFGDGRLVARPLRFMDLGLADFGIVTLADYRFRYFQASATHVRFPTVRTMPPAKLAHWSSVE